MNLFDIYLKTYFEVEDDVVDKLQEFRDTAKSEKQFIRWAEQINATKKQITSFLQEQPFEED